MSKTEHHAIFLRVDQDKDNLNNGGRYKINKRSFNTCLASDSTTFSKLQAFAIKIDKDIVTWKLCTKKGKPSILLLPPYLEGEGEGEGGGRGGEEELNFVFEIM